MTINFPRSFIGFLGLNNFRSSLCRWSFSERCNTALCLTTFSFRLLSQALLSALFLIFYGFSEAALTKSAAHLMHSIPLRHKVLVFFRSWSGLGAFSKIAYPNSNAALMLTTNSLLLSAKVTKSVSESEWDRRDDKAPFVRVSERQWAIERAREMIS